MLTVRVLVLGSQLLVSVESGSRFNMSHESVEFLFFMVPDFFG